LLGLRSNGCLQDKPFNVPSNGFSKINFPTHSTAGCAIQIYQRRGKTAPGAGFPEMAIRRKAPRSSVGER